jgi:large subunit ribosomal protein L23
MDLKSVIKKPIITEKSLQLASQRNAYTLEVDLQATKQQVKIAAEKYFKVKPTKITTIKQKGELKRSLRSRHTYRTPDRKKAILFLPEGQKLSLFEQFLGTGGAAKENKSKSEKPKKSTE